ncbi:sensor histidine kinase [Demequina silvatica]|uniref:sensor histidine kinase n=1 Tax=Demequina silvatica TaxID=1638988 RepID=UPI000A93B076|nr:HAMP domain-containing sensor histidine kinase [Demequina silvatica]
MTSDPGPASDDAVAARRGLSVRTWILAAVVGLSALALGSAGLTAMRLQEAGVEIRIDEDLRASAEEFRVLASVGVDPETGEPFTSPQDLVRTAMERIIPARNEGVLGVVGSEVSYTSRGAPVALEEDQDLVDALAPLVTDSRATFTTLSTPATTYRVAVVPVRTATDGSLTEEPDDAFPPGDDVAALVLAYDLEAERAAFREVFRTYALVAIASLAVVAVVGWIVAGRLLRPVRVLAASARRIGREDLSERIPVVGNDDLADMTRSVNEMLERLDESFAAQRRLIDDVSHELRTPLTVVRGHLELMDPDDGEEAREVRALALDEVDRMNRVIDDLTTLATADRPDFVRLEPLDLGTLTDEVFDKAVALGDRRWRIDARAEATVDADRHRMTQAWLQLAANAVKYSAPGSAIAIGSRVAHGAAAVWVEDEGIGVPPEDRERIFERFVRAGDRSAPGSGLGLAIVSAIARAHGGEARCDAPHATGSRFTIELPAGHHAPAPTDAPEEAAP